MADLDLTDKRQHAEAVAYGKLLAVRQLLDALAKERPPAHPSWGEYGRHPDEARSRHRGRLAGYEHAVRVVKATRLGVEQ